MQATKFKTVDEYLSTFPAGTKAMLKEMRKIIKAAAPGAEETISYNMPAVKFHGRLVYYAGYKAHIGFYPFGSSAITTFKKDLVNYEQSKGTVRFPLDKPLPVALITKMVKFRIKENLEKEKVKKLMKKK